MKDYEKLDYYNVGIEAIQVIEELNLNFSEGNAFKYLYRSNNLINKGEVIDDLNKAIYYLRRMLNNLRKSIKYRDPNNYLKQLDSTMFSTEIYEALTYTLYSACTIDFSEKEMYINNAIDCVDMEINKYQ